MISPAFGAKRVLRRPVPLKKGVRYSSSLPVITAQGPQSPNAVYVEAEEEEEEEEVEEEEEEEEEEEDRFGGNVIISNRIDNSNTGNSNNFDDKKAEDSNIKNDDDDDDDDDDNSNANIATTTTNNNNDNVNKENSENGRKNSVVERMPADPKAIGEDLTWLPPNPTDCTLASALPLPVCCTLYMTQLPLYLWTLFMMQCRTLFMMQ